MLGICIDCDTEFDEGAEWDEDIQAYICPNCNSDNTSLYDEESGNAPAPEEEEYIDYPSDVTIEELDVEGDEVTFEE